jgi:peptide chain release factor subunit 1
MEDSEKKKLQLRKVVKTLESKRARHTELISQYVPAGYNINLIINQLSSEAGTARNIKSATTRKNVIAALEKMIQQLRLYKQTPENGLALFSGNVSEREGQQDIQAWSIEPPMPLSVKLYRCDQAFLLDPLKDMMTEKESIGLLVMDRREATLGILKGSSIRVVNHFKSMVPGKYRAGGQSAARFARVRENLAKDFYKKVGSKVNEVFKSSEVKKVLVGGPGKTKEELVHGAFIANEIKDKILAIRDIGYTDQSGLNELVEKSEDVIKKEEIIREKEVVRKFFELLNTRPNMVAYGKEQVRKALEMGAVDKLLVSEDIFDEDEDLLEKAEKEDAHIFVISKNTTEGKQLIALGGLAAILRYQLST